VAGQCAESCRGRARAGWDKRVGSVRRTQRAVGACSRLRCMGGCRQPEARRRASPRWAPARLRACRRAAVAAARAAQPGREVLGAGRASTERPSLLRRLTGSPRARPERVLCTGRAVCGERPEAGGAGAEVAAEVLARDQQPEGGALPGRAGGDSGDDAGARPRPRREGARACALS